MLTWDRSERRKGVDLHSIYAPQIGEGPNPFLLATLMTWIPHASCTQLLMATVADKFPTPCMSSFWTPDRETSRQVGTLATEDFEACFTDEVRKPATAAATCEPTCPGSSSNLAMPLQGSAEGRSDGLVKASPHACRLRDDNGHAGLEPSPAQSVYNEGTTILPFRLIFSDTALHA